MGGDSTAVPPTQEQPGNQIVPSITVYEDQNFGGDSTTEVNKSYKYVGGDWNDRISSFKIQSGEFEFFSGIGFGTDPGSWSPIRLGPGDYPWVGDVNIGNDSISSFIAYFGVGIPVPVPPVVPPVGSTPAAKEYISFTPGVLPTSSCVGGGIMYISNGNRTRSILAYYYVNNDPTLYSSELKPNESKTLGCSFGAQYRIDDATTFLT